ncbi:MAG: methylated-DNA--[protein]-cysteine S-methyltransferase [Candidatus Krumholzibacteria bacterium]|nr:methylated-DNA--[protein]-cysteine S-methyltransferase [Candidatus Krumholzibacteria bacterium]
MDTIWYAELNSPLGKLTLESDGKALTRIRLPEEEWEEDPAINRVRKPDLFKDAAAQLGAYFRGEAIDFDLELNPPGTPFQKMVWDLLREIPSGQTITYGELAIRTGNPKASRAVGAANGKNPIPIIIPCHRVIGSNGKLTGYAGGLEAKKKLLEIEKG